MPSEDSTTPFLGYADEREKGESSVLYRCSKSTKSNTLPHIAVALATSLFWVGLIFVVRPGPASISPSTSPQDSPQTNTATPDVTGTQQSHHEHPAPPGVLRPTTHNMTSGAHVIWCPESPAEARAAGCKYDVLLNNWVPAQCFDQRFVDEYKSDLSWQGYADEEMTIPLKEEELSERSTYYTSLRDHVNHCSMIWRKQFWTMFEERRYIDTVMMSPEHTDHCAWYLTEFAWIHYNNSTLVEVGFAGCWVRPDERHHLAKYPSISSSGSDESG